MRSIFLTPRNKYRVSVAGFNRDYISEDPSLEPTYGYAMYHWGIWVEPKGKGPGRLYHVEKHALMQSADGEIPGGWRLESRPANSKTSQRLIGRILIGKLPAGMGFPDVEAVLNQIPLPAESNGENCIN